MVMDIRIASYNIEGLFRRAGERKVGGEAKSAYAVTEASRRNKALVVKAVGADVLCLQEVESEAALLAFRDRYLKKAGVTYRHATFIEGGGGRGRGMGILSRYPVMGLTASSVGIVEAALRLSDGEELKVVVCHFTSRGYGTVKKGTAMRRRQCTDLVRVLTKGYDLKRELVVVAGDLGDGPTSSALRPLIYRKDLHDPLHLAYDDTDESWTHLIKRHEQTSYILVSDPMKEALWATGVERRGMPLLKKHTYGDDEPFSTIKSVKDGASHHGCVWADFDL